MSDPHHRRARLRWLLLAVLLAACSTTSVPEPVMVPLGSVGNYGYADVMLQDDRYQVSYMTPRERVSNSRADREAEIAAARGRAHDLALWHAAQLGRDKGFATLKVLEEHTDSNLDTTVERGYEPDPFFFGFYGYDRYPWGYGPWYPHRYGFFGDPFYDPFYGPGTYYERPRASLRVSARLVVRFFKTAGEDTQSIDAVIDEMSKKYANATYP